MNKIYRKGSAHRRALTRSRDKIFLRAVAVFIFLFFLFISGVVIYAETQPHTEGGTAATGFETQNIKINTAEACDYGVVSVFDGETLIYQYVGEIHIENDGSDGKDIDVRIVYPDDTWPCSCDKNGGVIDEERN